MPLSTEKSDLKTFCREKQVLPTYATEKCDSAVLYTEKLDLDTCTEKYHLGLFPTEKSSTELDGGQWFVLGAQLNRKTAGKFKVKLVPRSLVAPGKQGPADIYCFLFVLKLMYI